MYRDAIDDLKLWFDTKHRKPLVLRGARQVGKSTLVRLFAEKYSIKLHEINLEKHISLNDIFQTMDMELILLELEGLCGRISRDGRSILFLDEIQATPRALQVLRYFYEEMPRIPVIAAGSLLEFTLSDHSFSMPVGRIIYYHLGPMSFKEFLFQRDSELYEYYAGYKPGDRVADSRHEALIKHQRDYLYCGGMPEAVQAFLEDPLSVSEIHRSLIDTYQDDFAKYAGKSDLVRLQRILNAIPGQIGRKLKYVNLCPDERAADVRASLDLLIKAKLCFPVYHSDCSGIPLKAGRNTKIVKLLFLDVGLMSYITGLNWNILRNMNHTSLVNEGGIAEQFVGQELILQYRDELHYWLREGRSNNAEVDFVIPQNNTLLPIEVKAGKSGVLKSLHQFIKVEGADLAVRFDTNKASSQTVEMKVQNKDQTTSYVTFTLDSFPLYFAGRISSFYETK